MRTVVVDKIASIAQAAGLGHELRIATSDIPCEEGVLLVVEILTTKSTYNTLELTSGRMAKLARGRVKMAANDCLTPDLLAESWVLTCQSECVSQHVRIEYPD